MAARDRPSIDQDQIALEVEHEAYASPTVQIRFEPLAPGATLAPSIYLWLHVGAGLDELFRTYRERGVRIVRASENRPWGLRQFTIEDCNGYRLAFSAEPAAAQRAED